LIKYYKSRNKNKIIKFTDKSFRINTEIFNKKTRIVNFMVTLKKTETNTLIRRKYNVTFKL